MNRRVVVTGLGLVSSLGGNLDSSWQKLIDGKSGIKKIPNDLFSTEKLGCKIGGLIPKNEEKDALNINDWIASGEIKRLDMFSIFGKIAAKQAMTDSGLELNSFEARVRSGVIIGSGIGGLPWIEKTVSDLFANNKRCNPFFIPASISNMVASHIATDFNFHGPTYTTTSACASGGHAIIDAVRTIINDDCDVMITGGSEGSICYAGYAGFLACRALSTKFNENPTEASRPWDRDRDGFVMGEGSGILVLEELGHAKKRGAKIYAEIVGWGASCDSHHITSPHPEGLGAKLAMQHCLRKANVSADVVDYINAHGTSTPAGDEIELNAVADTFGVKRQIFMSSNKSSVGHLLGAAAGLEAIFTIKNITHSIIAPTLNLHNSINKYDNISLVPHESIEKEINYAISNSFGFGGTNTAILFKKFSE